MSMSENIALGARNLLINCAGLKLHESLLIISEDPETGWYDEHAPRFVADEAKKMGLNPTFIEVGSPENVKCPKLNKMIQEHDCTIFFSRIGDQERFSTPRPGTRSVMSYIRNLEMLGSAYGCTNHHAYCELKSAVDDILISANKIEITCPLGTHFIGGLSDKNREEQTDVTVHRFPLGVPAPLEAKDFSGRIVMDRYLAPTGSKVYDPPFLKLDAPVFAEVKMGKIVDFSGPAETVGRVKAHYKNVSKQFDIDPDVVHSWHAGIHPASDYKEPESNDPDRWSNSVFTNPNYIHFHTCGDYAPGEISCTIPDHTIKIDGKKLWDNGRLQPHNFETTNKCLKNWPELSKLFNYSLT